MPNGADAYRTATINTADPVTLVSMLYDGALKAVRRARIHAEDGNRAAFFDQTERANLILGELFSALDMSQGELPATLSGIYSYCMRLLTEATPANTAGLDEVEQHIGRIAESWRTMAASLTTGPAATVAGRDNVA